MPEDLSAPDGDPAHGLSVGLAAARLGLAASTLRSWERRYALAPTGRSSGGHRRYTESDLDLLLAVRQLVTAGQPPARAALLARVGTGAESAAEPDVEPPADAPAPAAGRLRPGGPGGRVLAVPGGSPQARGLARAATALDADTASAAVESLLAAHGVATTWDDVLRPVLVAAGAVWARTGAGVEVEHLLTQAVTDALTAYRRRLPARPSKPAVVLACAPQDQHSLPLHVLAAALAEDGVPARLLGTRVPVAALAATARRTGAGGVFVWAQLADPALPAVLAALPSGRRRVVGVAGGPGWAGLDLPAGWAPAPTLRAAVDLLGTTADQGAVR